METAIVKLLIGSSAVALTGTAILSLFRSLHKGSKWNPKKADSWAVTSEGTFYIEKIQSAFSIKGPFFCCPHCLEDLKDPGPAPDNVLRFCPICQRNLRRELCSKPLHEFNREEQFNYLYDELCVLTMALSGLNHGYSRHYGRDSDLDDDEIRLGRMVSARDSLLDHRSEMLAGSQSLEEVFMVGLLKYPGGDGGLSYQFERSKLLRREALQLSKNVASLEKITQFQLDLVNETSWGAYSSSDRRNKVIEKLKARLVIPSGAAKP